MKGRSSFLYPLSMETTEDSFDSVPSFLEGTKLGQGNVVPPVRE